MHKKSVAFTLLELIMVVAIMGVIIATIIRFRKPTPEKEPIYVVETLNRILAFSRQESQITRVMHRIVVQSNPNFRDSIRIERHGTDEHGKTIYTAIEPSDLATYIFPTTFRVKEVFIQGRRLLEEQRGVVAFHIIPDGVFPPVTIFLERKIDALMSRQSLILEPFLGKFRLVEGFVRPIRR